MNPKSIRRAVPGRRLLAALRRGQGRVRALHAQQEALGPPRGPSRRRSATTATTSSRSPSSTAGWPRRPRRPAPTSSRRPRGQKLLVEDDKVVGVRTGDKGRDKDGGQKGNFEPGSDVMAKATVLAEGCWGHLTGAAQKGLGLAGNDPQVWALGVKEVWEVEKPLEQGHPHARLAAAPAGEVPGVRRLVDLRHEPRGREAEGVDRVRVRARQRRRAALGPRPAAGVQAPPARQEGARGRQARRLGREGDPGGRLLGAPAPAPPRHGHLRRRGRHGQRAQAEGDPLRDRVRAARRGDDLQAAQGRLVGLLGVREGRARGRHRQGPLRVAQHEAALRQGADRRRRDRQRDDGDQGPLPGGPLADAPRRRGRRC